MVTVKLIARLVDSVGSPLRGKPIYFYYEEGGTWIHIATAVTNDDGYAVVTHDVDRRTVFKVEFKGDDYYEAASATAVWEPSGGQVTQSSQCQPLFRTGIGVLDKVVLCVGSYGVTVAVLLIAFSVLLLLVRRKR